jgi:hypothetical protein
MAPQVGLEPTTLRLTAECSAIELLRNKRPHIAARSNYVQGAKAFYNKWVPERQGSAEHAFRTFFYRQFLSVDREILGCFRAEGVPILNTNSCVRSTRS